MVETIKAFVIDDEMPARNELIYMLEETGKCEVVGEAGDVKTAVELIKSRYADVMFLDINMPGYTGLQLAEVLKTHPNPPAVVFVTAYSDFALKAFDVNALDYLVKPVEPERLASALEKVRAIHGTARRVKKATPGPVGIPGETRVTVNKGGKKHFLQSGNIVFIMARDDYSYLYTADKQYLSTTSLANLEEQLVEYGFFRVHRRYIVNLSSIVSVEPQAGGTLKVTLNDKKRTEVPVSRRRVGALKQAMGV